MVSEIIKISNRSRVQGSEVHGYGNCKPLNRGTLNPEQLQYNIDVYPVYPV